MGRYSYHKYLEKIKVDDNDFLTHCSNYSCRYWYFLNDENTTFLTFSQWKTLYEGDPEGWYQVNGKNAYVTCPCYIKIDEKGNRCWNKVRFIKFLHRRDFKKWLKFLKNAEKKGLEYDNLQEVAELTSSVRQVAQMKLKESQKQVQIQYDEMRKLLEKNTSNVQTTPIPTLVFKDGKTFIREIDENGVIHLKEG
jgi:hypothetical protein